MGAAGTIVVTSNAGINWIAQTSGTDQSLTSIDAISTSAAHIVGLTTVIVNTANGGTNWIAQFSGTKSFDQSLTYKYLKPGVSHTVIMDAMDTLAGALRGYQAVKTINISPGKDTTITPASSMVACGGTNAVCL